MFNIFFFENRAVYEIMWENIVERDRPQMTIWRMCTACWIPKGTNTHSQYLILPQCYVIRTLSVVFYVPVTLVETSGPGQNPWSVLRRSNRWGSNGRDISCIWGKRDTCTVLVGWAEGEHLEDLDVDGGDNIWSGSWRNLMGWPRLERSVSG